MHTDLSLADGTDYRGHIANLTFAVGDSESCHTVNILQDDECEHPVLEDFFANLAYVSGMQNINIVRDRAQVLIDDSSEPECGELIVCVVQWSVDVIRGFAQFITVSPAVGCSEVHTPVHVYT